MHGNDPNEDHHSFPTILRVFTENRDGLTEMTGWVFDLTCFDDLTQNHALATVQSAISKICCHNAASPSASCQKTDPSTGLLMYSA